jgi:prepilin-type N-terminal cleavage/methylation domain-containing protein
MATRRQERGFTLLEVVCAFTILALVISIMVTIWSTNIETAIWAIDKREMREVADTIFGKILFEQQEHRDGDEGSLAVIYGQWAGLPAHRADRYRDYHYRLRKQDFVSAGEADPESDTENLFGDPSDEESTDDATGTDGETEAGSVKLVRFTMTVFRVGEDDDPLITLTRYMRPPETGEAN